MSQSSASSLQTPNPMRKKVLAALIAVAIGHVGVLFAISQMKGPELKKIEKDPIKVRFVQITEDAPPPPPPPPPVQPQVKPKPEPKVVEPPPVVKPKIIAEKPKPKVEKSKPVVDDTQEKLKREQERLEKQRQQQEQVEQQKRDQAQREQQARDQQMREQQARDQQAREEAERRAQEARNKPRTLSQGQISWVRSPRPSYSNADLKDSDRTIVVEIDADASGHVTNVKVIRSSGLDSLDQKIVRAVRGAKFKPYKENGVAYPFKAQQPFELKLNSNG